MHGLELLTPPASEPLSLAEAKAYLRLDTNDDDALVTALIAGARQMVEQLTGRALIAQGWRYWRDKGAAAVETVRLPKPPLTSVCEVAWVGDGGDETVLDPAAYLVDTASDPGRVVLTAPLLGARAEKALRIDFTAGYGADASAVPEAIKTALRRLVAHFHAHREIAPDASAARLVEDLLAPYRTVRL